MDTHLQRPQRAYLKKEGNNEKAYRTHQKAYRTHRKAYLFEEFRKVFDGMFFFHNIRLQEHHYNKYNNRYPIRMLKDSTQIIPGFYTKNEHVVYRKKSVNTAAKIIDDNNKSLLAADQI